MDKKTARIIKGYGRERSESAVEARKSSACVLGATRLQLSTQKNVVRTDVYFTIKERTRMIDRLFVSKGCQDCARIRSVLDMNAVIEDEFTGASGQELYVFSAQSNNAARDLLDAFKLDDHYTPLLVPHNSLDPIDKTDDIISWLRENNMTVKG